MRKALLLLAVLGLVGTLWGADPAVGTWKFNMTKSKPAPTTEAPVKEATVVIRETGTDQLEIAFTGKRTDGSAISAKYMRPKQG